MRNIQKLIAFVFVLLACSCTTDDFVENQDNDKIGAPFKSNGTNSNGLFPVYSQTSLVVLFKAGTSDLQKAGIRGLNGVNNYEVCHCTNKDIELWHFGGTINVEPKKRALKGQIDPESTTGLQEVDYEFVFGYDIEPDFAGTAEDVSYLPYIKSDVSGITVAVVDTGIAPGLTVFNDGVIPMEILYKAGDTAVADEQSGWDFVSEDPNTYDDDTGKHGSIISSLIVDAMLANNIDFQLLPIKVSGPAGETSYFNFLCGTLYAMERAQVVNISMGWYDTGEDTEIAYIFEKIVAANPNVILVTSAGNSENNNDELKHFPSSFIESNIISIASANQGHSKISQFSNYGIEDVDFFAQGEEVPIFETYVNGTSFAAPQVAIEIMNIINDDEVSIYDGEVLLMETLLNELDFRGTAVDGFFTLRGGTYRNTKYNKLIIPFD